MPLLCEFGCWGSIWYFYHGKLFVTAAAFQILSKSFPGHNLRQCQRHETIFKGKGAKMFKHFETT